MLAAGGSSVTLSWVVTAAGFLRRIDPRDESVILWICKDTDEAKQVRNVFLQDIYLLYITAMKKKSKVNKSEDNSIALIKFIDLENQAILKFNKKCGEGNNSITLRSISFIFHICQNTIMLSCTKAKQLLLWLYSTLIERINMLPHCSDSTVDMFLSRGAYVSC